MTRRRRNYGLERTSGPVAADRAKTSLSGLFAQAIDKGYAEDAQGRQLRWGGTAEVILKRVK